MQINKNSGLPDVCSKEKEWIKQWLDHYVLSLGI